MRRLLSVVFIAVVLSACVMSMPADQFYSKFPKATDTAYLTRSEVAEALLAGSCIMLDSHRYDAPIGTTVDDDLRHGALGVDAIVSNDGGDAYRISNFNWAYLATGATQLQIEFDTLLCRSQVEGKTETPDQLST